MERKASAQWNGGLKDGKGTVSTASGAVKGVPYTFAMRFGDTPGTNPEELVAAAHAGCFSMALSGELDVAAKVPGADPAKFQTAAKAAEKGCPISRLLKADITMTAKLV